MFTMVVGDISCHLTSFFLGPGDIPRNYHLQNINEPEFQVLRTGIYKYIRYPLPLNIYIDHYLTAGSNQLYSVKGFFTFS